MTNKEYFHDIFKCLSYKQLGKAINLMHSYKADNPTAYSDQSLHSIEEDYTRMLNYMEQGFQDPDRDRIYQKLLQRMWTFTANAHIGWLCREVPFYRETQQRSLRHMFTQERILNTLQNFVTETAMLSLEPEETRSLRRNSTPNITISPGRFSTVCLQAASGINHNWDSIKTCCFPRQLMPLTSSSSSVV